MELGTVSITPVRKTHTPEKRRIHKTCTGHSETTILLQGWSRNCIIPVVYSILVAHTRPGHDIAEFVSSFSAPTKLELKTSLLVEPRSSVYTESDGVSRFLSTGSFLSPGVYLPGDLVADGHSG